MAVQTSYPGVYIDEFAPGAPIQGVGTATAAFIGPAERGFIDRPERITSWDRFCTLYGARPLGGWSLWYAVRGFFDNGGQVCYIVRASNGTYAQVLLQNGAGNDLLLVRALQPGPAGLSVEVVLPAPQRLTAAVYQPTTALTANTAAGDRMFDVTAGEGIRFKAGDEIQLGAERRFIERIGGDTIRVRVPMADPHLAADVVRLADATAGATTVRLVRPAVAPTREVERLTLGPGATLHINQGLTDIYQIIESVQTETIDAGGFTYRVTFRAPIGFDLILDPVTAANYNSCEFDLWVRRGGGPPTRYEILYTDPEHERFVVNYIRQDPAALVEVDLVEPPPAGTVIDRVPASSLLIPVNLVNDATGAAAAAENLTAITAADFIDALTTLRDVDDVNLIACPDAVTLEARPGGGGQGITMQQEMIAHCEQLADRFAVLDSIAGNTPDQVEGHRRQVDSTRGYAALYYPWVRVRPFRGRSPLLLPPSGHVCGIIARTDITRGVHKAPANVLLSGVSGVALAGVAGVERRLSDTDHGLLNLMGVNVIRIPQQGGRPNLMGARTTATDRNWMYVNVRRLFLYVEESIQEGIAWAVFEPNNLPLWAKLRRTITAFLVQVWRDGALFGATPEEAFYVRIDEQLNPFSEQALGRLYIEIGMRPAYPAEFIIVRIGIWDGGAVITES